MAVVSLVIASPGCRCDGAGSRDTPWPHPERAGSPDVRRAVPGQAGEDLSQRIDAGLLRAARFLASQQGDDGGFRSATYAAFRDGYSLTPLALTALYFSRPGPAQSAPGGPGGPGDLGYRRGVDFLATLVTPAPADSSGAGWSLRVGLDGPRYPVYAIAGAILVLNLPDNQRHRRIRDALLVELRRRQLSADNGWTPDDPSYGAWSYYKGIPARPSDDHAAARPDPGLTGNLSATLFAIGALRLAGVPAEDPALVAARSFVERCQNLDPDGGASEPDLRYDGGFFFSPVVADSNKAGPVAEDGEGAGDAGAGHYRSYGSMTADGLRALVRLGLTVDHPRVSAAATWLERRYRADRNPGDFPANAEIRRESSYFYYVWTSSHALRALGASTLDTASGPVDWPRELARQLLSQQRRDGSWSNPYTELREDDPILATSFAAAALAIARMILDQGYRSHGATRP